jgi:hypothetical protein
MKEIREIYQRWLNGSLTQEDALFAIGDVLNGLSPPSEADGAATDSDLSPSAEKRQGS